MSNKTYDALKNLVLGGLPILITLLNSMDFEKAVTYAGILTTILGWATIIASKIHDKNDDGKIDWKDLSND